MLFTLVQTIYPVDPLQSIHTYPAKLPGSLTIFTTLAKLLGGSLTIYTHPSKYLQDPLLYIHTQLSCLEDPLLYYTYMHTYPQPNFLKDPLLYTLTPILEDPLLCIYMPKLSLCRNPHYIHTPPAKLSRGSILYYIHTYR